MDPFRGGLALHCVDRPQAAFHPPLLRQWASHPASWQLGKAAVNLAACTRVACIPGFDKYCPAITFHLPEPRYVVLLTVRVVVQVVSLQMHSLKSQPQCLRMCLWLEAGVSMVTWASSYKKRRWRQRRHSLRPDTVRAGRRCCLQAKRRGQPWTLDLQPSELQPDAFLLSKPPSLWSFVVAALAN